MSLRSLRDLFGDPEGWENHISDGVDDMPDMKEATILDVFVSGNQVAVYTRNFEGVEALSIFFIDDPEVRARVASASRPGASVHDALTQPI